MGLNGLNGTYSGPKWDSELIRQVGVHFGGVFVARLDGDVTSTHYGLSTV